MWDPGVAAGTVPHQNIGYLFPMGPYYWLAEQIGVPDWVAQRLWIGLASMAAAVGVHWLLADARPERHRPRQRCPPVVAATAYQLSPYLLPYVSRHSVLLGAWAALPWLCALTAQGVARRRLAMAGVVRRGAGPGREHQRQLARVRAPRTADLARVGPGHQAKRPRPGGRCRPRSWRCSPSACRSGGSWACGSRPPTASTSCATPSPPSRSPAPPPPWRASASSATGTSTAASWSSPSPRSRSATRSTPGCWSPASPSRRWPSPRPPFTRWRYRALSMVFVAVGLMVAVGAHPWGGPAAVRSGPATVLRDVLGPRPALHAPGHAAPGARAWRCCWAPVSPRSDAPCPRGAPGSSGASSRCSPSTSCRGSAAT